MAKKNSKFKNNNYKSNKRAKRLTVAFVVVFVVSIGALFAFARWGYMLAGSVDDTADVMANSVTVNGNTTNTALTTDDPAQNDTDAITTDEASVPSDIRVYMPLAKYSSLSTFESDVNTARNSGFTEVIVDVKDTTGRIYFNSTSEPAAASGAVMPNSELVEMSQLINFIHANEMKVYGKITAFADDLAALTFSEYTLMQTDGERYFDTKSHWMNIYVAKARDYVVKLCREAAGLGFDALIIDKFYLPVTSEPQNINYADDGVAKTAIVEEFVTELRRALDEVSQDLELVLYIPPEAESNEKVTGCDSEKLATIADSVINALPTMLS